MLTGVTVPGSSVPLHVEDNRLKTPDGASTYPVVHGIPVVFPSEGQSDFPAYVRSLQTQDVYDPWQVQTLAIDAAMQRCVSELIEKSELGDVDPVVKYLICATNGIAYEHQVGRLADYPIPVCRLPPCDGTRMLDLGCSWGRWCISAARQGYRVTGIDPSLGALLAAKRVAKQFSVSCEFVCGDARCLPFADKSFDVVHSYSVLQHLSDEDAASVWRETARILRPGGKAVIQMAKVLGVRSLYHLFRRGLRRARQFEVRYRLPNRLRRFAKCRGPGKLAIDCFFGLGLQDNDKALYGSLTRRAILTSNTLVKAANFIRLLNLR